MLLMMYDWIKGPLTFIWDKDFVGKSWIWGYLKEYDGVRVGVVVFLQDRLFNMLRKNLYVAINELQLYYLFATNIRPQQFLRNQFASAQAEYKGSTTVHPSTEGLQVTLMSIF